MKFALHLLTIVLTLSTGAALVHGAFTDVGTSNEHSTAIAYIQQKNIVSGYADGTFKPNNPINRVELLKILMEAEHPNTPACRRLYNYSDVDWNAWYGTYLQQASCLGIVEGYPDGTFKPADQVNVAEALKLISEAFVLEAEVATVPWYRGYAEELIEKNAIPTDIQYVGDMLTRGQMAEIIYRIHANVRTLPSVSYEELTNQNTSSSTSSVASVSSYCGSAGCNKVSIETDALYRYVTSNGLPNHATGTFPNSGNPNSITEQNHSYRMLLNPSYQSTITDVRIAGVALNGVPMEPGTAETYQGDPSWSIEAFDASGNGTLGIDFSNAHVQPTGTYHYHGIPIGLLTSIEDRSSDLVQLAWAADGFPMYYSTSNAYASSWQLKQGTRPSGPGGTYDGTYTQDFEYVAGSGDLDECNGVMINGSYGYIMTTSFPYIQRCVHGQADSSFTQRGGGPTTGNQNQPGPGAGGPPQEAIDACTGKSENAICTMQTPNGSLTGVCRMTPERSFACIPR